MHTRLHAILLSVHETTSRNSQSAICQCLVDWVHENHFSSCALVHACQTGSLKDKDFTVQKLLHMQYFSQPKIRNHNTYITFSLCNFCYKYDSPHHTTPQIQDVHVLYTVMHIEKHSLSDHRAWYQIKVSAHSRVPSRRTNMKFGIH